MDMVSQLEAMVQDQYHGEDGASASSKQAEAPFYFESVAVVLVGLRDGVRTRSWTL